MTSALGDGASEPAVRSTSSDRHKIARKWAYQVGLTTYMPLPHAEIELALLDLVNGIFDAMTSEPLPTDRIGAVGARLVELNCVGAAGLQTTMDVLAGALLSAPELGRLDRVPERIVHLLGALAAGYVDAIRSSTMQQQDTLHRALLEAMWLSERRLAISESQLGEVLAGSPCGIAITNLDGRLLRANAAFTRIAGPPDPGTRRTLFDLIRPLDNVDVRRAYQDLHDGEVDRLILRLTLCTGRASLSASLLRDIDAKASGYVTILVEETG